MNVQALINTFEAEMGKVSRKGVRDLMTYIRKSDFYTAPASTRYHLSCEGGLLQHSLNVLNALRGLLVPLTENKWAYRVAMKQVDEVSDESVVVMALLHDICKTHFYSVGTRNVKNETTGKWEKAPFYTVDDKMPLGHGAKSAMIVKEYMKLTPKEMYAIWWHMGFSSNADASTLTDALEKYPIIWALHTADMMASHMIESSAGNRECFAFLDPAGPPAGMDDGDSGDVGFQEAPPLTGPEA